MNQPLSTTYPLQTPLLCSQSNLVPFKVYRRSVGVQPPFDWQPLFSGLLSYTTARSRFLDRISRLPRIPYRYPLQYDCLTSLLLSGRFLKLFTGQFSLLLTSIPQNTWVSSQSSSVPDWYTLRWHSSTICSCSLLGDLNRYVSSHHWNYYHRDHLTTPPFRLVYPILTVFPAFLLLTSIIRVLKYTCLTSLTINLPLFSS